MMHSWSQSKLVKWCHNFIVLFFKINHTEIRIARKCVFLLWYNTPTFCNHLVNLRTCHVFKLTSALPIVHFLYFCILPRIFPSFCSQINIILYVADVISLFLYFLLSQNANQKLKSGENLLQYSVCKSVLYEFVTFQPRWNSPCYPCVT